MEENNDKVEVSAIIQLIEALNKCNCNHHHDDCKCDTPTTPSTPDTPATPDTPITDEEKQQLKEYLEKFLAEKLETLTCTLIPRHDTSTNWGINDPVLENGEYGVEDDTHRVKRGDGKTPWTELPYETFGVESVIATTAADVNYDNTLAQISKVNVQDALDYLVMNVKDILKELEKKESTSNMASDFEDKTSVTKYPSVKAVADFVQNESNGIVDDFSEKIRQLEEKNAKLEEEIEKLKNSGAAGLPDTPTKPEDPSTPASGNYVLTSEEGVISWKSLEEAASSDDITFEEIV